MAEFWMVAGRRASRRTRVRHDVTAHRSQVMVGVIALTVTSLISRLAAMYRMPGVHPLASLTTDSDCNADYPGPPPRTS
jgi:hypothetical protein